MFHEAIESEKRFMLLIGIATIVDNITNELAKSPKVSADLRISLLQRKSIFELRKIVE